MDNVRRWLASFLNFWASLKLWQRASIFFAVFLVLGGLIALIFMTGSTNYEPLYAGLEVSDQAAIVDYLKENNLPYRLDPKSNAILMPNTAIYETRLTLAQMGLPKGGTTGFEVFDNAQMGMSEFQQRIAYMRAIEGELARTISQMSQVENARVSVVIPEQRLFLEQQKPSTASVLLRLRPGATIGPTQVKSIIHLVAHSVDGLEPDAVTVVDTNGRVLSDMVSDSMIMYNPDGTNTVTSVQRELERQHERELENRVRIMLEQVYGPGSAVVRVRIDLDFDKKTSSYVEYSPNPETGTGVPRSNERQEESYTGQGNPVNGGEIPQAGEDNVITVGATLVPHAEILKDVVAPVLAKAGWTLETVEFNDYVLPNTTLEEGELDANYFQTLGYLNNQNEEGGLHLAAVVGVHIEPMGVYSQNVKSLSELPDGAVIGVPNDTDNYGRAIDLLNALGLLVNAPTDPAKINEINH